MIWDERLQPFKLHIDLAILRVQRAASGPGHSQIDRFCLRARGIFSDGTNMTRVSVLAATPRFGVNDN